MQLVLPRDKRGNKVVQLQLDGTQRQFHRELMQCLLGRRQGILRKAQTALHSAFKPGTGLAPRRGSNKSVLQSARAHNRHRRPDRTPLRSVIRPDKPPLQRLANNSLVLPSGTNAANTPSFMQASVLVFKQDSQTRARRPLPLGIIVDFKGSTLVPLRLVVTQADKLKAQIQLPLVTMRAIPAKVQKLLQLDISQVTLARVLVPLLLDIMRREGRKELTPSRLA